MLLAVFIIFFVLIVSSLTDLNVFPWLLGVIFWFGNLMWVHAVLVLVGILVLLWLINYILKKITS